MTRKIAVLVSALFACAPLKSATDRGDGGGAIEGTDDGSAIEAGAESSSPADAYASDADGTEAGEGAADDDTVDMADAADGGSTALCPDSGPASRLVMFGGSNLRKFYGDSWQWDGNTWTRLDDGTDGGLARQSAAMAHACGQTTLFGGFDGMLLNDQFVWTGSGWVSIAPSVVPTSLEPRTTAAFAALSGSAMLFGGGGALGSTLADTWVWDGANWSRASPVDVPSARSRAAVATTGTNIVLFGGLGGNANALGDTWLWDGANWSLAADAGGPSPRYNAAAASLHGDVVLFGGDNDSGTLGETWVWHDGIWTQQSPMHSPSARGQAAAGSLAGRVVIFGGVSDGPIFQSDTWTWDGSDWTQITPGPESPSPRASASITELYP